MVLIQRNLLLPNLIVTFFLLFFCYLQYLHHHYHLGQNMTGISIERTLSKSFSKYSQKFNLQVRAINFFTLLLLKPILGGVATRGARGTMLPPLQFPNQTRSNSFSLKHQGYCFLRMFRNYLNQKFHDLYHFNFWTIYGGF